MIRAFAGIDLAFAKKKRLPVCLCRLENDRLIPLPIATNDAPSPPRGKGNAAVIDPFTVRSFAKEVVEYLHNLEKHFSVSISRIAIDAPSAPRENGLNRRLSEKALRCSCFTTPNTREFQEKLEKAISHLRNGGSESTLPAANQLWMLVGFELFTALRESWECLEVYPQATMQELNAAKIHKTKAGGVAAQMEALKFYTGWPDSHFENPSNVMKGYVWGSSHDRVDAYSAAWIASLESEEREVLGILPNDAIWVPRLAKLRTIEKS